MAVKTPKAPTQPESNGKLAPPSEVRGIGRTGLKQWSGRIDEEFLTVLKHERKYKVYQEMSENDPIVGAVLRAIEFLIRGVDWRVDPDDQLDDGQVEIADQISERLFHGMRRSWAEILVEILSFLPFGWAFHELLYDTRADGVWWNDWPIRSQDSLLQWQFRKDAQGKDTDEVVAMVQQVPTDSTRRTIPLAKGLLFRLGAHKNNPEGVSIIRNAYLPWYYKNHLQRIEAIGIERDLAGYPVLYIPGEVLEDTSGQPYLAAKQIVTNIKRDEQEGALLSSARDANGNMLWELKLLSTGGQRSFNTNEIIQRYDTRIAQTCLADFIVLGQQKVGSFALASSKTEIFSLALAAVLDTICGTINRYAIPQLAELNGWPTDDLPKLVHGDIEMPDLQELGAYISALSGAGIPLFPDMKLENRLREMGGLPVISPEDFDKREAQAEADKQLEMDAQLEAAKVGASAQDVAPKSDNPQPTSKGWVTINGNHVFIEDGEGGADDAPSEAFTERVQTESRDQGRSKKVTHSIQETYIAQSGEDITPKYQIIGRGPMAQAGENPKMPNRKDPIWSVYEHDYEVSGDYRQISEQQMTHAEAMAHARRLLSARMRRARGMAPVGKIYVSQMTK